jgi:hypothetical protein
MRPVPGLRLVAWRDPAAHRAAIVAMLPPRFRVSAVRDPFMPCERLDEFDQPLCLGASVCRDRMKAAKQ